MDQRSLNQVQVTARKVSGDPPQAVGLDDQELCRPCVRAQRRHDDVIGASDVPQRRRQPVVPHVVLDVGVGVGYGLCQRRQEVFLPLGKAEGRQDGLVDLDSG